jgi:hypothetical protein
VNFITTLSIAKVETAKTGLRLPRVAQRSEVG